jgi:hypothetical protein
MTTAGDGGPSPGAWRGRAPAPPPRLPDTAELPIVPGPAGPPAVVSAPAGRRLWTVAWVVAVMVLCFAAGGTIALLGSAALRDRLGLGPDTPESPVPESFGPESSTPTEPPPPGIGDPVRDTTVEFRVTDLTCGQSTVGEGVLTRRARGQYCVASFELRNVGGTLAILNVTDQYAVTTDGSRHRANADATAGANNLLFVLPLVLPPGESATGRIVFDIPADATLATLVLHDSERSDGAVITIDPSDLAAA